MPEQVSEFSIAESATLGDALCGLSRSVALRVLGPRGFVLRPRDCAGRVITPAVPIALDRGAPFAHGTTVKTIRLTWPPLI